jgi:type IV pilus assembly protein PilW
LTMILKHPKDRRHRQQGFTLTELLVVMAMTGIIMAAVYSTYKSQQDSYVVQEQVVEMQQNLRAALFLLAKDLMAAGFNPAKNPSIEGFLPEIPDDNPTPETSTSATSLAMTADLDMDGSINTDDHTEQLAYRFNAGSLTLEKFMYDSGAWNWQTVADNIEGINFVYLDGDGNPLDPSTATNLPLIRSVQVTVLARTGRATQDFTNTMTYTNHWSEGDTYYWSFDAPGDNYRRRLMTTTILCRNMGT